MIFNSAMSDLNYNVIEHETNFYTIWNNCLAQLTDRPYTVTGSTPKCELPLSDKVELMKPVD
jgi:hypothetical protein